MNENPDPSQGYRQAPYSQTNQPATTTPPQQPAMANSQYGNTPERSNKDNWKSILSTVAVLIAAPLLAITLIAFVFQSYEVDGPSMETTLQDNDRLIVVKTGKTWAELTGKDFIPKRGEIVIFNKSGFEGVSSNKRQLIKRVIGLPGDRVVVKDQKVTIYNDENPDGFNPDKGTDYVSDIAFTSGNVDLVVPEGEVFVAGDNRTNSLDSRSFGTVKAEDLVGTLTLRIFPLNKISTY